MNSPPAYGSDPLSPNTTFVQADPSTFRAVVQKLTGAPDGPSAQKLPHNLPSRFTNPKPTTPSDMGPRRPVFKLHERRQTTKKLELNLTTNTATTFNAGASLSPSYCSGPFGWQGSSGALIGFKSDQMVMPSPVSPFEFMARGSPRTPVSPCPEEDRAIAEKGFYLHPSTPKGSEPRQLLPLFPLSPRDSDNNNNNC